MTEVCLSDVAKINPRLHKRPSDEENVSFLGMADVDAEDGTTRDGADRLFGEVAKGYTPFQDGDLLVAKITPCFENGKIAQARLKHHLGMGSTEFHVVRPDPSRLDARYALHLLRSLEIRRAGELRMTGSAGQKRVPESFLRELPIRLPPLEQQRRISRILAHGMALQQKMARASGLLGKASESRLHTLLDSSEAIPRRRLRELASLITKGTTPTSLGLDFDPRGPIPFLRVGDLGTRHLVPEKVSLRIATKTHEELSRSKVRAGDLLVSIAGTIGRVAIAPEGSPEMNCNQAVAIVRLHDGVSKSYVRIWLDSADARHQMGATSVTGTITNLSLSQLGNLQIPEPPQDQLLSFEESSRAINRTIHAFESRANKAQELVNALSARAFRGEL